MTFCSRYLEGVETAFNRTPRNYNIIVNVRAYKFSSGGRVLGKVESVVLDQKALAQAHRYVLLHSDIISEYSRFVWCVIGNLIYCHIIYNIFNERFNIYTENFWLLSDGSTITFVLPQGLSNDGWLSYFLNGFSNRLDV